MGRVTGVVEDGEPWYCELHPDPRYASCHASLVPPPIGERYQVSCIPELQPSCRLRHVRERPEKLSVAAQPFGPGLDLFLLRQLLVVLSAGV